MLRTCRFLFAAIAGITLMAALADDAAAAIRGGGFRSGRHFGRWRYPYSYSALSYDPYGYGAGPGVMPVYVGGGSAAQGTPAIQTPNLTCKHNQEIVTVPMENGTGMQQIRITRC